MKYTYYISTNEIWKGELFRTYRAIIKGKHTDIWHQYLVDPFTGKRIWDHVLCPGFVGLEELQEKDLFLHLL